MIYIAICDDEKYLSDKIKDMVSDFFLGKRMEVTILQFSSGEELLEYGGAIDVLFLDIQMGKTDGMETARKLRSRAFRGYLIFVTVLKEMVFHAFEVQAYDYLVKPIKEAHFEKTMKRLFLSLQKDKNANLLVRKGNVSSVISFDEILFCEVMDRKVYLHLRQAEVIDY